MLAKIRSTTSSAATSVSARLAPAGAVVLRYAASAAEIASGSMKRMEPYLTKLFNYGFIPLVILLGMQSEPRPKLIDLLTPM